MKIYKKLVVRKIKGFWVKLFMGQQYEIITSKNMGLLEDFISAEDLVGISNDPSISLEIRQ